MTTAASAARRLKRLIADRAGSITLEWVLVMVVIALPFYAIFQLCMALLIAHYQMVTFLHNVPFP